MSSYKLKQWYPSLPENWKVNDTISMRFSHYTHDRIGISSKILHSKEVENNPEFWEKVVEKDYEILSFYYKNIGGKGDTYVDPNYIWFEIYKGSGKWSRAFHITHLYSTDEILRQSCFGIHSIKRLSDGEIFTIGDRITGKSDYNCIINSIELNPNYSQIMFNKLDEGIDLINARHIKQPLFKTEDGVDIYKGDIIHLVTKWFEYNAATAGEKTLLLFPGRKIFSTEKIAIEYIIMNKPCLSINDVLSVGQRIIVDEGKLKQIVKSKLK